MYYIVQTIKKITIIFKNICKITACGMVLAGGAVFGGSVTVHRVTGIENRAGT